MRRKVLPRQTVPENSRPDDEPDLLRARTGIGAVWSQGSLLSYHAQQRRGLCGPACIQMIVGQLTGLVPDQERLAIEAEVFEEMRTQEAGVLERKGVKGRWDMSPKGGVFLLNRWLQQGLLALEDGATRQRVARQCPRYAEASFDDFETLLVRLTQSLDEHGHPVLVCTNEGDHWQLVLDSVGQDSQRWFQFTDPGPSIEELKDVLKGQNSAVHAHAAGGQHGFNDCCSHLPDRFQQRWCGARHLQTFVTPVARPGWEGKFVIVAPESIGVELPAPDSATGDATHVMVEGHWQPLSPLDEKPAED